MTSFYSNDWGYKTVMQSHDSAYHHQNKSVPRPLDRYVEISGPDAFGKPKANIVLNYSDRFSDGTSHTLQELTILQKPIVSVFRHAGYVNVLLDFKYPESQDLYLTWQLLQEYSQPINGVCWLPEELESGYFIDLDGQQQLIYFPMLELGITPVGKEKEFQLIGLNPLFFTLQPNGLSGTPCVIQFTFPEAWFHVVEDLSSDIDLNLIRDEVMEELALDKLLDENPEQESDFPDGDAVH